MYKIPECPYCRKNIWKEPYRLGMFGQKGDDGMPMRKMGDDENAFVLFTVWACATCGHARMKFGT